MRGTADAAALLLCLLLVCGGAASADEPAGDEAAAVHRRPVLDEAAAVHRLDEAAGARDERRAAQEAPVPRRRSADERRLDRRRPAEERRRSAEDRRRSADEERPAALVAHTSPAPPAPPPAPPPATTTASPTAPRRRPSAVVRLVELCANTAHRYGVVGWIIYTLSHGVYITLALPTEPWDLAAGAAYGVAAATAAGALGKTIGSYLCLLIGRRLGPRMGLEMPQAMRSRLTLFRRQPFICICLARLAPVTPGIKNYALALIPEADLPVGTYMISSAVIAVPLTFPWCVAGHAAPRLADALEAHGVSGDRLLWGVIAVPLAIWVLRKAAKRCRGDRRGAAAGQPPDAAPRTPETAWLSQAPADDISMDDMWDLSSPPDVTRSTPRVGPHPAPAADEAVGRAAAPASLYGPGSPHSSVGVAWRDRR
eukprot:TRINITY_DN1753_c0_g1_i1.p1 TRINITY_DN1753_c0_g1~~TRINITY_DN1753_c0_g1_i1.p1  ORF type:complete len:445 (+),score=135.65 TRINITY_DN1753_c0_g1_i1:59-1336(+)